MIHTCEVRILWDQRIRMRDGVEVSGDIYLPENGGKYPAIVVRTPYGKGSDDSIKQGEHFSDNGFAVVICDVRGRGDSDGDFVPYFNEGKDGYDVIEWVASQPWCTGSVGTMGGSYLGRIQWLTALEKPPHLRAMICAVSPSDPFVESPTGVPDPIHISWSFLTSGRSMQNVDHMNWENVYRHLPLIGMDEVTGRKIKGWKESFDHTTLDRHWEPLRYQNRFSEIDLPVMHISGWYDDEQIGTPLNYIGMRNGSATEESKRSQKLLMGPWPHRINQNQKFGDIDFGPDSIIDLRGEQKRWFDRWLKDEKNGVDDEDPVRIFVMGENKWRSEKDWPLPGTEYTPFYFNSGGRGNSRLGDGTLSTRIAHDGADFDSYTYDPERPFPFITDITFAQIGGPDDYSAVERRDDVLVYTSEPLKEKVEVTGPIAAELHVSSDAEDTDFTVKLVDVWPSGFAQRLCDGIVRARFRDGMDRESPIVPGDVYRMNVDMWNTCQVFLPGHSIRVEVSSSAFPKYARNQNVWEKLGRTKNMKKAEQRLYHSDKYPSKVVLPLVRR